MASADISTRRDWILVNPWLWMAIGFSCCGTAWLLTQVLGDVAGPDRLLLLALGLLGVGASLALRLQSERPALADRLTISQRTAIFAGLAILFGLITFVLIGLFAFRLIGVDAVEIKLVSIVLVLILTGPTWAYGFLASIRRVQDSRAPINAAEEAGVLLVFAALALFFSQRALYLPEDPLAWDTMRLFLGVAVFITLFAAGLMLLPQTFRRVAISGLLLFHFGGICTAVLSTPPSPWIIGQLWTRVYRPYLEFMSLTDSYRYYSPEPGPSSYLWFRVFWLDDETKQEKATWLKIPRITDDGWSDYPVSLTHQRMRVLADRTAYPGQAPPRTERDSDGNIRAAEYYERRFRHSNLSVAQEADKPGLIIPMHPTVPDAQQYAPPDSSARRYFACYIRHVARMRHPNHPEWKIKSVKVYRVVHVVPPPPLPSSPPLHRKFIPQDPDFYRPYYMGEYDPDGTLLSRHGKDPFLYWLLPIVRDPPATEAALIRDYARKHAGDPAWLHFNGKWMDDEEYALRLGKK